MNALSLFSGIGGLDIAAELAGIKVVAFCEKDKFCQKILSKHWPKVPCFDDIKMLKGSDIKEELDIIFGGYPCQPFSVAGKRKGKDDDRYLWPEFSRLIDELRPTWVVGENVVGHITKGLDDVIMDLEAKGYATRTFVFPASAVGARHQRYRTFIIGFNSNSTNAFGIRKPNRKGADSEKRPSKKIKPKWDKWQYELVAEHGVQEHETYADIVRDLHGIPNRVDRLKSLGNAVVPKQAYPIFNVIMNLNRDLPHN